MAALPEIYATGAALRIDGEEIAYDAVTHVAYVRQVRRASGAIIDVVRRFELGIDGGRRTVKLDGAKVDAEAKQELWARLVEISQRAIEPRLRDQALERVQRHGETVAVARLELDRAGFAVRGGLPRRRSFAWSEHGRTFFATDRIRVTVRADGKPERKLIDVPTEDPNAVLLPRLMAACAEALA